MRQRITFQHHLGVLSRDETRRYLAHRMLAAGYSGDPVFGVAASTAIHRASRGLPRLVNILANKALMLAYGEGFMQVTPEHVREAVRDTPASGGRPHWHWAVLGCIVLAGLALLLWSRQA